MSSRRRCKWFSSSNVLTSCTINGCSESERRSEKDREGHGRKEEIWGDGAPEGVCEGGDATVGDARTALEAQRREARAPA